MKLRLLFQVFLAILIFGFLSNSFGQSGIFAVQAGYLNPKDAKAGLMVGGTFGTSIDEAVDLGIGIDIFHNSYSDESHVASSDQSGLSTNTYITNVEYTRTIIPINLVINVKLPVCRYMGYFIRGGIGYQFLFSKEKNYELEKNETRRFGGLGWQGGAGLYYDVGRRSTVIADIFYNNAKVSRSVENSVKGLPTSERISLSGLGFRLGVILDMR